MTKGANLALDAGRVRATVTWTHTGSSLDISALVLGADGHVASDDDFVFYNQPVHPSGSVRHGCGSTTAHSGDVIEIDLPTVPAAAERVTVVASTDSGSFGSMRDLRLVLSDAETGAPIATFPLTGAEETALICGELYRRAGSWKFRAVGQGYRSGLAGVARDFGISVADPGDAGPLPSAAPSASSPAAPPALTPPPAVSTSAAPPSAVSTLAAPAPSGPSPAAASPAAASPAAAAPSDASRPDAEARTHPGDGSLPAVADGGAQLAPTISLTTAPRSEPGVAATPISLAGPGGAPSESAEPAQPIALA